jgi:arabinogalactan endo-1,4-beta-galactosidase
MRKSAKQLILKRLFIGICFVILIPLSTNAQEYMIGADLSFMKEAEDKGFAFKENEQAKPGFEIFRDHGYNWVRLRLFHTPTTLPNSLEYTIEMAKEAKKHGFKFLLDYHYSDTWADPAKQYIPKAWEGKSQEELEEAVFEYTRNTMISFREAGVFPDMVQVGNEISNGMLWPNGKLPENWDHFAGLVQAGINGVYASCDNNRCPEIMIHIDKGGDLDFTKYFYDKITSYGIQYDVIGQSYYPWWHGSLLDLRACLNFTAETYKKDVVLVEVAYNYQPQEYKDKKAPFPETPEGQKEFLEEVNRIILNIPNNRGKGIFWWEAAAPNKSFSSRTFFKNDGNVQPVISVFDKFSRH